MADVKTEKQKVKEITDKQEHITIYQPCILLIETKKNEKEIKK